MGVMIVKTGYEVDHPAGIKVDHPMPYPDPSLDWEGRNVTADGTQYDSAPGQTGKE
jgi:hypothetical protein